MEDYIFLIIAIILSVLGAVNNKKKKARAQQNMDDQEPKRETRPSVFEQLFEDSFFDEEIKEKPVTKQNVTPQSPKKVQTTGYRANYSAPRTKTEMKKKQSDFKKSSKTIRKSIRSDFSLKKAVIYSEILNRKY